MSWPHQPFKWYGFHAKYHLSCANKCKFPEELSTGTGSWICIVQAFLEGIKRWVKFVNLKSSSKVFSDVTEVRLNITQNLNKGCRLWQQPRVDSELLETKQRPFGFDVSHWNQASRMETQQSRIECQLAFEEYSSVCWQINVDLTIIIPRARMGSGSTQHW